MRTCSITSISGDGDVVPGRPRDGLTLAAAPRHPTPPTGSIPRRIGNPRPFSARRPRSIWCGRPQARAHWPGLNLLRPTTGDSGHLLLPSSHLPAPASTPKPTAALGPRSRCGITWTPSETPASTSPSAASPMPPLPAASGATSSSVRPPPAPSPSHRVCLNCDFGISGCLQGVCAIAYLSHSSELEGDRVASTMATSTVHCDNVLQRVPRCPRLLGTSSSAPHVLVSAAEGTLIMLQRGQGA